MPAKKKLFNTWLPDKKMKSKIKIEDSRNFNYEEIKQYYDSGKLVWLLVLQPDVFRLNLSHLKYLRHSQLVTSTWFREFDHLGTYLGSFNMNIIGYYSEE